jgi:hypothetical protein
MPKDTIAWKTGDRLVFELVYEGQRVPPRIEDPPEPNTYPDPYPSYHTWRLELIEDDKQTDINWHFYKKGDVYVEISAYKTEYPTLIEAVQGAMKYLLQYSNLHEPDIEYLEGDKA